VIIEPPIVIRTNICGINIEVCHGIIPDIFREQLFEPVTDFELPDAKKSDEEFYDWIELYSISTDIWGQIMLEASKCN
jgi:hypothetical protein